MTWTDLGSGTGPYISLAESVRQNARRHLANAARHMRDGKPDYAKGSLAKANRNWKRAEEIARLMGE